MIFQIIDDKKECRGYFANGKLRLRDLPESLTATWDWSELIDDRDVILAKIIAEGKTIQDACPDHLKDRLEARERKIKSHLKSFISAKVRLSDVCFYNLVPQRDIEHYYNLLNDVAVCSHAQNIIPKQTNTLDVVCMHHARTASFLQ